MTNKELIERAASVVRSMNSRGNTVGDVGCALLSDNDNVYVGVCIDTPSSMGFCAEHNAIGAMTTAGESRIKKIVAVQEDRNGNTYVLAPCGRCRQFIYQTDTNNLETEVVLTESKTVPLKELLPYHDWSQKL